MWGCLSCQSGHSTGMPKVFNTSIWGFNESPKQPIPPATWRVLVPCICLPFLLISAQLENIINSPGIEEDLDWWKKLNWHKGVYQNISDGKIWNETLGPDGQEFFRSTIVNGKKCAPNGELQIGVALAMDWWVYDILCTLCWLPYRFSINRSALSNSYSTAPLSFSILSPPWIRGTNFQKVL